MAEIKSPVITEISGRLDDLVFYRRGGKNYVRKWVKPKDPRSPKQVARRENFACLVKTWQNMNSAMKKTWRQYPGKHGRPYNAFMSENLRRTNSGEEIVLSYKPSKTYCRKSNVIQPVNTTTMVQQNYSLVITSVLHEYSMNLIRNHLFKARNGPICSAADLY